jgi:hypothetical protein
MRVGDPGLEHLYEPDYNNFLTLRFRLRPYKGEAGRFAADMVSITTRRRGLLLAGFQNGGPEPGLNPLPGLGVFNLTFPAGAPILMG